MFLCVSFVVVSSFLSSIFVCFMNGCPSWFLFVFGALFMNMIFVFGEFLLGIICVVVLYGLKL